MTLAQFVQEQRAGGGASVPPPIDYLSRLPHQPPFRFVSKVTDVRPGDSAEAELFQLVA